MAQQHDDDTLKLGTLGNLTFDNLIEVCLAGDIRAYHSLHVCLVGAGNTDASKARAVELRDMVHTKLLLRSHLKGRFAANMKNVEKFYTSTLALEKKAASGGDGGKSGGGGGGGSGGGSLGGSGSGGSGGTGGGTGDTDSKGDKVEGESKGSKDGKILARPRLSSMATSETLKMIITSAFPHGCAHLEADEMHEAHETVSILSVAPRQVSLRLIDKLKR